MKIPKASQGRQKTEIVRTLSDGFDTATNEAVALSPVDDDELLDGYSKTEKLELSVTPEEWEPSVRRN